MAKKKNYIGKEFREAAALVGNDFNGAIDEIHNLLEADRIVEILYRANDNSEQIWGEAQMLVSIVEKCKVYKK